MAKNIERYVLSPNGDRKMPEFTKRGTPRVKRLQADPLKIGPPLSSAICRQLLRETRKRSSSQRKTRKRSSRKIDSRVVRTFLKLTYYLCLKKRHVISLRMRDVFDGNLNLRPADQLLKKIHNRDTNNVPIKPEEQRTLKIVKAIATKYVAYLRKKKYRTGKIAPLFPGKLFPGKSRASYTAGLLDRHLKEFTKNIPRKITLEDIKDQGMFRHYLMLAKGRYQSYLQNNDDLTPLFKEVGDFAGIGPGQAETILTGKK